MKGYYASTPWGMIFQRHYCHKCGTRLRKEASKRIVTPYDKDYAEYTTWRSGNRLRIVTDGDIQVTEHHFKCPECQTVIKYSEQRVIRRIQKKRGALCLTEQELEEDRAWAEERVSTAQMIREMIYVGIIACIILCSVIGAFL